MILSDIKRYLIHRKQATLADIALYCDAPADAVRGMLEQWIRKGKVTRSLAGASCGANCTRCDPADVEIYRWVDAASAPEELSEVPITWRHPCNE
jgi:hypothetical protein